MSSDDAYTSFLEKANQPLDTSGGSSDGRKPNAGTHSESLRASQQSADIPASLRSLNATLTSESDEPFEPFSISYRGSRLPDASEFASAIRSEDQDGGTEGGLMEELAINEFDPRGDYSEVVEAVRQVAPVTSTGKEDAEVKCYREEGRGTGKTRVVYYLVVLDSKKQGEGNEGKDRARLVGVRALSVES